MDKPDGLTVVALGEERAFLAPLPISKLWGVGPKTAERLIAEGVETIADIAGCDEEWLRERFGRHGAQMQRLALGQDDSPVVVRRETKSVSAETTFARDTGDPDELQEVVSRLSQRVANQLRRKQLQGTHGQAENCVCQDFTTFTRPAHTTLRSCSPRKTYRNLQVNCFRAELYGRRRFRLVGRWRIRL